MGGHSGFLRTYKRMAGELYWSGMKTDVRKYVESCEICQRNKTDALKPASLFQPLPIPYQVWEDLTMDFMVVVDRLSKYNHFVLLKHPYFAKQVVEVFVQEIVKHHGFQNPLSQTRIRFSSVTFGGSYFRHGERHLNIVSPFVHRRMRRPRGSIIVLRCFCNEQPLRWSKWLPWAKLWYDTTFHPSTKMTPHQVVYERPPPPILSYGEKKTSNDAVEQQLMDRTQP